MANMIVFFSPCKIVLTLENSDPFSMINIKWPLKFRAKNRLIKCLDWFYVKRADIIRFVSNDSAEKIVKIMHVNPKKCITIKHGTDFNFKQSFKTINNNKFILNVSTILPHKNLDNLIRAFSILVKKHKYNGKLVILGDILDTDYYKNLNKTSFDLNISSKVEIKGKIIYNELVNYYQQADVFVFTSIEETFGIPLLEAMASGLPTAASDCNLNPVYKNRCFNPFREICDDAILYFDPFDPQDIAEEVNKILTNSNTRNELITKGFSRAALYTWDETAKQLINTFNHMNN